MDGPVWSGSVRWEISVRNRRDSFPHQVARLEEAIVWKQKHHHDLAEVLGCSRRAVQGSPE